MRAEGHTGVSGTAQGLAPQQRKFLAEFSDPAMERRFRVSCLGAEARQLMVLMLVVLPANAAWLISDYIVSETGTSFWLMLGVRVSIILVGVGAVIGCFRTRSPGTFTGLVVSAGAVAIGGIFFFDMTRPTDYLGHYTIDMLVIVALYFVAPLPLRMQVVLAIGYTTAMIAFYFAFKESPHEALYNFNIPASALIANFIGYSASHRIAMRRRREFYLFERESEARAQLQNALDNVKTLSGLLPICASCKKIRDDKGYWNHVEAYLAARSEVAFTHGLCPECENTYRRELSSIG